MGTAHMTSVHAPDAYAAKDVAYHQGLEEQSEYDSRIDRRAGEICADPQLLDEAVGDHVYRVETAPEYLGLRSGLATSGNDAALLAAARAFRDQLRTIAQMQAELETDSGDQ